MSRAVTFGIIGGYSAAGSAVISELLKSCDGEILIGGRDLARSAATTGPGVHFLFEAVDPITFMAELKKAGVEQTENFKPCA